MKFGFKLITWPLKLIWRVWWRDIILRCDLSLPVISISSDLISRWVRGKAEWSLMRQLLRATEGRLWVSTMHQMMQTIKDHPPAASLTLPRWVTVTYPQGLIVCLYPSPAAEYCLLHLISGWYWPHRKRHSKEFHVPSFARSVPVRAQCEFHCWQQWK